MMAPGHRITSGDLFASGAHTLVNAVNCRGVMGAGIAAAFKRRYPEMFNDYRARCSAGEVRLGEPYVWQPANADGSWVLNFPTKDHWRDASTIEAVDAGLAHLADHYETWGIESLAIPALGCGLGQLAFEQVLPVMTRHLRTLDIPVAIYRPRS